MSLLKIEYLPTASLTPYARNARAHPKNQILQIQKSMTEFGFTNPILVDEASELIAGHGRLLAARGLDMSTVPVVRLSGLTDAQKRKLRLADNKIALNSAWDKDLLQLEIQAISQMDIEIDLSLTGFCIGEIEAILADPKAVDIDDDAIPATPQVAVSRAGDIWLVGEHRVACGDCRDRDLMVALSREEKVDGAFLDVPYNMKINGGAVAKGRHREFKFASGEMSSDAFQTFLSETLGSCLSVSRNGAVHFVCIDHHHLDDLFQATKGVYSRRLNLCVWNKSNAGMGSLYRSKHELVGVFQCGDQQPLNTVELGKHGRNRTNVWDYQSVNTFGGSRRHDLELHPSVKPLRMVADAICDVTKRGDRVLDAFLGSGTTLLAAERVGRRCLGVDVDELYVDLALARFLAQTGVEAVLEETGLTFSQVARERAVARPTDAS